MASDQGSHNANQAEHPDGVVEQWTDQQQTHDDYEAMAADDPTYVDGDGFEDERIKGNVIDNVNTFRVVQGSRSRST